jgi:alkylation response protein AidB-like acyl-CoA dehydrogenase
MFEYRAPQRDYKFVMQVLLNGARLGVANEGVAASEAAFQGSLTYALDRLQTACFYF